MGRKRARSGFQWVRDDQDEAAREPIVRTTHREIRAADARIGDLAEQLLARRPIARAPLGLPTVLEQTLLEHGRLSGGARNRNMRRLKSLIRGLDDLSALEAALADETPAERRSRELERWRSRLLRGTDADVQAFVDDHPTADRTVIRTLVRAARREGDKGLKASKKLYQVLKATPQADEE